jgi:hypothetical protein
MDGADHKDVENACDLIIAALASELQKARAMSARVGGDGHDRRACPRLAIRHFCAALVETSVELSRQCRDLTSTALTE